MTTPVSRQVHAEPSSHVLRLTIDKATRDKILYALELLGPEVSLDDLGQVIELALKALIEELEQNPAD